MKVVYIALLLLLLLFFSVFILTRKTKNYVTVNVKGRLGNQLFEIISMWVYAKRNNINFVIKKCYIEDLKYYKKKTKRFIKNNVETIDDNSNKDVLIRLGTYDDIRDNKNICNLVKNGTNVFVDSYLQNANNFNDYRQEILEKFFNIVEIRKPNNKFFIHIRLTDFQTSGPHIMNLDNYYKKAIEYIYSKIDVNNTTFYIVSDDAINARKQEFLSLLPLSNLIFVDNKEYDEIKTLELFKECCSGGIMGHSTFAWWGAYIINCPEKIVVCPNKFLNEDHDYSGLYLNYKVIDV